jgi:hypothetical protein
VFFRLNTNFLEKTRLFAIVCAVIFYGSGVVAHDRRIVSKWSRRIVSTCTFADWNLWVVGSKQDANPTIASYIAIIVNLTQRVG